MRPIAAFLLAVLLLTGCSAYRDPVLTVSGASLGGRTDEAVQVDFALDLSNPNGEPLELIRFEYDLAVAGRMVYSGKRSAEATLNGNATRSITIPTVVRFDRVPADRAAPLAYRLSGRLLYVTPGEIAEILLDTGIRRPKVAFSDVGRLHLQTP